jgi:predicted metal-dependent HD superfamily phosphohydrolase
MADETASIVLGERFRALWASCLPPGVKMDATPVYEDLVGRYTEPGRHYHGWAHLAHCLQEFDRAAAQMENPNAVELALWFHDAVYVPGAVDNEQRSAELFRQRGNPWFSPTLVEKVCELILITMHRQSPDEDDESYVVDIDLSSFAVQWSNFLGDARNVRKEQADVPDSAYYPAHAKFLKMLLNRPSIFHTAFFYERYEESARQNINRLLATPAYSRGLSGKT